MLERHEGRVSRIVVIGDIHGDLGKARRCAELAGVAGPDGSWRRDAPPVDTVVVQLGDQIDGAPRLDGSRRPAGAGGRHDCAEAVAGDLRVMAYFDALDRQAAAAGRGCRVYSLLGNHEVDNAAGDVGYADVCPECTTTRAEYFRAGGAVARHMAGTRRACLVVGGVLFSHAGVLPAHLPYLDGAGEAAAAFLRGDASPAQLATLGAGVTGPGGLLRHRAFAPDKATATAADVEDVLAATRCNAMVLGHNAHREGVSSSHGGRVWVVDPGMSSAIFDAEPTVLDIAVGQSGDLTITTVRARARAGSRARASPGAGASFGTGGGYVAFEGFGGMGLAGIGGGEGLGGASGREATSWGEAGCPRGDPCGGPWAAARGGGPGGLPLFR